VKLLYRSITNACINLSQRRRPTVSVDAVSETDVVARPGETGPETRLLAGELHEMVAQALSELPVNQRAVMELSSLGYSAAEIAEMIDLTAANTRQLLHRAREAMKMRLQPYLEGKSS
jgi:RNA polymerase sigma-70 factor (ECF subfamily)